MKSRREGNRIFIRLETGDDVHASLISAAEEHGAKSGWFQGIGAGSGVELGYYDLARKDYNRWEVAGDVEFASVSGSLGILDGKPFVHLHAVVSDRECVTHGGHLFRATTGATLEFVLLVGEGSVERTFDEASGLNLWRV
ncbi:MAG TPA: PPC domain-containing DNA-binding protein [Thermoanaerobaculia bacterium]|nr:PPC domain-containing DNA-binding protein [Thermoanaerobaculia bacterium]